MLALSRLLLSIGWLKIDWAHPLASGKRKRKPTEDLNELNGLEQKRLSFIILFPLTFECEQNLAVDLSRAEQTGNWRR